MPLNYAGMRLDDGSTAYAKDGERVTSHFFGQSSFSALTITRARNVVKVDTSQVALELLGPLGCGFQTGAGGVMNSLACPAGSSIAIFGGGPVGLATLAAAVGEDAGTLEEVYEPFLMQQGFLDRTQRGRVATALAFKRLGIKPPAGQATIFDA